MPKTHITTRARRFLDLTNQTFGHLLAIEPVSRNRFRGIVWKCLCDCGKICLVPSASLRSGNTKSCSCRQRTGMLSHGGSYTRIYRIWVAMLDRCESPKHKAYASYGGRGIVVCERWHTFQNFRDDMDNAPTPQHTIDRIDPNGIYEPSNCRWATRKEQSRNRRNNRIVTIGGDRKTLAEWCERFDINYDTAAYRLNAGWLPEDALGIPVSATRKYPHKRTAPQSIE